MGCPCKSAHESYMWQALDITVSGEDGFQNSSLSSHDVKKCADDCGKGDAAKWDSGSEHENECCGRQPAHTHLSTLLLVT